MDDTILAALNAHCSKLLPAHMRPAIFVGMSELPLNQNMKIDRKKLPVPNVSSTGRGSDEASNKENGNDANRVSPLKTNTEHKMARLWKNTLCMSDSATLNASDDFFVLGGLSLSAAEVVGEIRSTELCPEFAVLDIFENPKLVDMAAHIDKIMGIEFT